MIIYGLTSNTSNPTKAVQDLNRKYLKALRKIYRSNTKYYNDVFERKKEVYNNAWVKTFGELDEDSILSIGHMADILSTKLTTYIVGKKVMQKASDSFYFSREDMSNELSIEEGAQKLCDNIFIELNINTSNKLKMLKTTIKNTLILEGKI
jgi:hypothetical protein